ncbi:phosphatidylinositol 4-phosphate 5-kinase 3-like [Magnolia sinica]|uniref:phosphatidylinositol 4-phosphate 5-kinase 3-like n=1 Tax=Magnolia sinica TaxID=86752 RepID=UPI0026593ED6|nr:phosphatidylinositol 4-phosphate 5-kinase 3-like [Magnolia sinica]
MDGKGSDRFHLNEVKVQTVGRGLNSSFISNSTAVDQGDGDLHLGFCCVSEPAEVGKYMCTDGCLYQKLSLNGKTSGKGMLLWPPGGTYLGHFLGCCMHQYGCYVVGDGQSNNRQMATNQKHGFQKKRYRNGAVCEGWWRKGVFYGCGRYGQSGGDMYVGQWKKGLMWALGCEYCRQLGNRLQQSHGVFNFAGSVSFYRRWKKGGIFRKAGLYTPCVSLEPSKSNAQTVVFRSEGVAKMELVDGKCRCMCCYCSGHFLGSLCCRFEDVVGFSENYCDLKSAVPNLPITDCADDLLASELPVFQPVDDQKRPGEVICKGHRSYKLVRVLQLGIRYFVGQNMDSPKQELSADDFRFTTSTQILVPSDGSGHSTDMFTDFTWKDYCPAVFRHLQEFDKIDTSDYMLSVCGNETLRELTSPGKSGCLLYLSNDDRFVIKTMRKSEMKVLLEMLPNYYHHVKRYRNTLLTKFYGLHVVQPSGGRKVHFVVMGNIFRSDLRIHRRFDLKGSSQGRCVNREGVDESTTFKDLDLDFSFQLNPSTRHQLLKQIKHDCGFLEAEGIMDYSLLLGVHSLVVSAHSSPTKESADGRTLTSRTSLRCDSLKNCTDQETGCNSLKNCTDQETRCNSLKNCTDQETGCNSLKNCTDQETDPCNDVPETCPIQPDPKLGVQIPARAIHICMSETGSVSSHRRAADGEPHNVVLYFGIIDILQGYSMRKRIEHAYKSLQFDPQSISAVNPKLYSSRFQDFMSKVFPARDLCR